MLNSEPIIAAVAVAASLPDPRLADEIPTKAYANAVAAAVAPISTSIHRRRRSPRPDLSLPTPPPFILPQPPLLLPRRIALEIPLANNSRGANTKTHAAPHRRSIPHHHAVSPPLTNPAISYAIQNIIDDVTANVTPNILLAREDIKSFVSAHSTRARNHSPNAYSAHVVTTASACVTIADAADADDDADDARAGADSTTPMPTERARPEVDSRDDRPRECAGPIGRV